MHEEASRGQDGGTGGGRRIAARAAVIAVCTGLIYWPALHGTWLWDDGYEVARNPALRTGAGLVDSWLGRGALDYFPLKATVQWILWQLWGGNTTGWHAASMALHAGNALLVWRLLHRLGLRRAWLGGLLFAVHPLAVESVAWIAELKNLLSLPGALLGFLAYLDYDERRRRRDLARAVGWFIAAMLCKSTVVMLPCILGLYLWWKHGRAAWSRWRSLVPFFAVALLLGLVTVWFQHERAIGAAEVPVGGMATRVARAGLAIFFYAGKALWPVELMPVYPRWPVDPPAGPQFLTWPLLGLLLGGCAGMRSPLGRHLLFGSGAFVLSLFPILGFLAMAYMHAGWVADHFAYVALPAVAGLFAGGVDLLRARSGAGLQRVVGPAAVALLLVLGALSWSYAWAFRSPAALWTYAVARNPASAVVRNNLGNVWLAAGQPEEAARHFGEAVRLEPAQAGFRINLGNALGQAGRTAEAILQHQRAVELAPGAAAALNSLGGSLLDAGRLAEARASLEAALRAQPDAAEAHNNLGIVLARSGEPDAARVHFETALRLDRTLPSAVENLRRLEREGSRREK